MDWCGEPEGREIGETLWVVAKLRTVPLTVTTLSRVVVSVIVRCITICGAVSVQRRCQQSR